MKNNPEIELQRFQEKYQKLMLGDNETVGLINVSNHLHETSKQININDHKANGLDFEKEAKYMSDVSKTTISTFSEFQQSLASLRTAAKNIIMPYDECKNFAEIGQTVKDEISKAIKMLEQYNKILNQKLHHMYSVDARDIDLTLVLDVAETFSSEKNLLDKLAIASKELLRTLDKDIEQIQKQLEENIKRGMNVSARDIIIGYEKNINQAWDELTHEPEFKTNSLYETMNQNYKAANVIIKEIALDLRGIIESDSVTEKLRDFDLRDNIRSKIQQVQEHMKNVEDRMNFVPQKHYVFCENATMFQSMVADLSLANNLELLDVADLDTIENMVNGNNEQLEHLDEMSNEMYDQSQSVLTEIRDITCLFYDNLPKFAQISDKEINYFVDDVAVFIEKAEKIHLNISSELLRQKSERNVLEQYVKTNKELVEKIQEERTQGAELEM